MKWITIIMLLTVILLMALPGFSTTTHDIEGLEMQPKVASSLRSEDLPDPALECRDPDTNLKIQDSDIMKDAKNLIINQGTQVRKLYTENGIDLISPKVADHILVDVMGVRKRPIYEKYPACAKQLAKSLKHEMSSINIA